uniref:DNA-directed RNA polymerase n=1 Tax=Heterorhabditis bacteriophora TaxID=37862 RepID=A0A1I7X811_HETBA
MEETCSLVHRLEEKYLEDDDSYVDQDIILTNFTGSSPCKMASKRALELIVLNHMNITHVGDTSRFASLVQHVAEVSSKELYDGEL